MKKQKKLRADRRAKTKSVSKKLIAFVRHLFNRKNEPMLHTVEWVVILLAFFAVGFPIIYYQSAKNIFGGGKLESVGSKEAPAAPTEAEKKFIGETITEPVVDITGWDTYRNQWYGFEIKHPDSWTNMSYRTSASKNSLYETIYKFRKDSNGENDPYVGFDVAIYSTKKAGSVDQANDLQKKDNAPEDTSICPFSQNLTLGEGDTTFQKVSVSRGNACYKPAYFFSATNGDYMYDIVPVAKDGAETPENLEQDVNKNFPEYKQVVASLKFIPVTQPVIDSRPRITAPHPVAGTVVSGRIICSAKHDHPSYSNKHKGKHLDEDCCPDPDEYPNPWCSYSASELSVMISHPSGGKS